jgi:hypothetical protein
MILRLSGFASLFPAEAARPPRPGREPGSHGKDEGGDYLGVVGAFGRLLLGGFGGAV